MNKKSIESGKDYQEHEFTHKLSKQEQHELDKFITSFLKIDDSNEILKKIGLHPFFFPKVKEVENVAKKTMPLAYQISNLATISDSGHVLRGGSEGFYSWFIQMYDITQRQIMNLYLNRLMYTLLISEKSKKKLEFEELTSYFIKSKLFNQSRIEIVIIGLKRYFEQDYISAIHILVPQFESFLLSIAQRCGVNVVALDTKIDIATRTVTLSQNHLDSNEFIDIFGEDFCRQVIYILFEPLGYKIRHKVAHGEITNNECSFQMVTLIVYLFLVLIARTSNIETRG